MQNALAVKLRQGAFMLETILDWNRKKNAYLVFILLLSCHSSLSAHTTSKPSRSSSKIIRKFKNKRKIGLGCLALKMLAANLNSSHGFALYPDKHLLKNRANPSLSYDTKKSVVASVFRNAKAGDNLDDFSPSGRFFFVFEVYLEDIELQTGLAMGEKQRALVIHALSTQTFSMVDYETNKKFHRRFQRKKSRLIKEWEKETGLSWPRYYMDIYNDKGMVIRFKGQPYDAHHIIECVFAGPSEWWNIHPAATQEEHQEGIHRLEGPAWWVYHDNCQDEEGCHLFTDPEYLQGASSI